MHSVTEFNLLQPSSDARQLVVSGVQGSKKVDKAEYPGNPLPTGGENSPPVVGAKSESSLEKAAPIEEKLEDVVKSLNDYVQSQQRELQFVVDEVTGRTVVKVYDAATDEMIRQIPSEQLLELSRRLVEQSEDKGSLFQERV
jgi:flagellar protein FlaG